MEFFQNKRCNKNSFPNFLFNVTYNHRPYNKSAKYVLLFAALDRVRIPLKEKERND